jgi:hypothetical protein
MCKAANSVSEQFHVLLLSGDAAKLDIMAPISQLSDAEFDRVAFVVDQNEDGGMVVTPDDPTPLKARYLALGFRVVVVQMPKKRSNETAHMVSIDLRLTGEYRQLRQDQFV